MRFVECSLFQAINSHNLQDESTSRLTKQLDLLKEIQASHKSACETEGTEQL